MSMAEIPPKVKLRPLFKGTVVCQHCTAEYSPGHWTSGVYKYETPTSRGQYIKIADIPVGVCPVCRTPNE